MVSLSHVSARHLGHPRDETTERLCFVFQTDLGASNGRSNRWHRPGWRGIRVRLFAALLVPTALVTASDQSPANQVFQFPIEVTVAAWQWGRDTEPKVQTAEIVRRSFRIWPE